MSASTTPHCPQPAHGAADAISLAHGEGGRLMRELLRREIWPLLRNGLLDMQGDAAVLPKLDGTAVFTTDSFVVAPRFFPGGDIGSLAVYGTVNDLAVAGARPRWLSLSLILEEGLPLDELRRIIASVAEAARCADVMIATGDTKVVPRGAVDGVFINTAGVGELTFSTPGAASLSVGDELLVTGPVGRHGMAVLAARESLSFDPPLESDCGPLFAACDALRSAGVLVVAMRDATRGGVAAVLHEWAGTCGHTLAIEAGQVPVTPGVRGACELLGLDPLHVACEGTMVVAVRAGTSAAALAALQSVAIAERAARIGEVTEQGIAPVVVRRALRRMVPLDEPLGALLPRIC